MTLGLAPVQSQWVCVCQASLQPFVPRADARVRASGTEKGAAYAFIFPNVMINRYGCAAS